MKFNDTRFKAFDENWFARNQSILLAILNNTSTKFLVRKLFGIDKKTPSEIKIIAIGPNYFKARIAPKQVFASFHAYDHMSNVIYSNLKYLWQIIHLWDTKIANKLFPGLNLGFDTLQFSNGALVIAGTVAMGYINDAVQWPWDEIRDGVTGEVHANSVVFNNKYSVIIRILTSGDYYSPETGHINGYSYLSRGVLSYNTSSIGSGNIVVSASLNATLVAPANYSSTLANDNLVLTSHDKVTSYIQESNDLTVDDFPPSMFGTDLFSEITWDYYENNSPTTHVFELNSLGCDYIKKTAHTAFGFMIKADFENSEYDPFNTDILETYYTLSIDDSTTIDLIYNEAGYQIVMMM